MTLSEKLKFIFKSKLIYKIKKHIRFFKKIKKDFVLPMNNFRNISVHYLQKIHIHKKDLNKKINKREEKHMQRISLN